MAALGRESKDPLPASINSCGVAQAVVQYNTHVRVHGYLAGQQRRFGLPVDIAQRRVTN